VGRRFEPNGDGHLCPGTTLLHVVRDIPTTVSDVVTHTFLLVSLTWIDDITGGDSMYTLFLSVDKMPEFGIGHIRIFVIKFDFDLIVELEMRSRWVGGIECLKKIIEIHLARRVHPVNRSIDEFVHSFTS
jgi:hypothetical protein